MCFLSFLLADISLIFVGYFAGIKNVCTCKGLRPDISLIFLGYFAGIKNLCKCWGLRGILQYVTPGMKQYSCDLLYTTGAIIISCKIIKTKYGFLLLENAISF